MSIVDLYLKAQDGLEISPPILNSALIYQTRGWNQSKYFRSLYKNNYSFPLLISVKGDIGLMYISLGHSKAACLETMYSVWEDKKHLSKMEDNFKKFSQKIENIYSKLTYKYIKNNNDLGEDLNSIVDNAWSLSALTFFTIGLDKDVFDRFGKLDDSFWNKASILNTESFYDRGSKKLKRLVEADYNWDQITEKCQYLEAAYDRILSFEFTKKQLQEKYKNLLIHKKVNGKSTSWKNDLSEKERRMTDFFQWAIDKRDQRKDYFGMLLSIMGRYAEHIFETANLSKDLINFCLFEEIEKGTKYLRSNITEIAKRKNGFSVLLYPDGAKKFEYRFYDNIGTDYQFDNKIIGQSGSLGYAKGKVKIITNVFLETESFKKGEILVTGMTRPEYVPLMKKAAAIITDEGGITCHAAIVSRELGKPCIIGTNYATKVLKDGDMVEVDASRGIVKKLSKH
ncbi:hypothetical protein KKH39_04185 [Patescibacteria group bacterium]|nr:hypothetical protein [Patescibacteria group bacterium]